MKLWRTKPLAAFSGTEGSSAGLRRSIGALQLTNVGIGAIIGAGIFVVTGTAAANFAGPAIVLSFVLAGVACLCAALCYAELAALIPIAGSAYSYAYATLGEGVAWLIGWMLVLEYLVSGATVAVGWSGYLVAFMEMLGMHLDPRFTTAPLMFDGIRPVATGAIVNLPAASLVVLLSVVLATGIRSSTRINTVMVVTKLLVILLVIGFGAMHVEPVNWQPFIPENGGENGEFGWSGIVRGAAVILFFFAYLGFDAVSTTAQEARRPQRDVPIGILASLGICTALYIAMALVLTGLTSYPNLAVPHPVYVAIDHAGEALAWLKPIVVVGALAGLASVVLVLLLGQSRIFFSMAGDGLVPPVFGRVHARYQSPFAGTFIVGGVAALIAALFPIQLLGELVSMGTLLAFLVVCAGVLMLRRTDPDRPRPFRTPAVWLFAPAGMLICLYLMSSLPADAWVRFGLWCGVGMLIYLGYGLRHSRLGLGASGRSS